MPSGRYSYPRHGRSRRFLEDSGVCRRIRRYLLVLRRYPPCSDGEPVETRVGGPILSDCPGMGADVPRRMSEGMPGGHLSPRRRVKVNNDGDSSPTLKRGFLACNHVTPATFRATVPPRRQQNTWVT